MARSWKYYLSCGSIILLCSCNRIDKFYEQFAEEDKVALANQKYTMLKDSNFYDTGSYYNNVLKYYTILDEVKDLNPDHAKSWYELSRIYLKYGMLKKWKEHFDMALFLDPLKYQGSRGHILLYYFKDYEKALADFNGVEIINPNGPDYINQTNVHYLMGICHMQLGNYKDALKQFEKYRIDETSSLGEDYLYDSYYLYMGITYIRMRDYQKSIKVLQRGIKGNDNFADFYYHLARAHYFRGDYSEILPLLEKAEMMIYEGNKNKTYDGEEIEEIYLEDVLEFRRYIKSKLGKSI